MVWYKHMRQYHILVFLTRWTASVCKMQKKKNCNQKHTLLCHWLTKLSSDNFKHEKQTLLLTTISSDLHYCSLLHQMALHITKAANFVNIWQVQEQVTQGSLWTHNSVTILHTVCKLKQGGVGRGKGNLKRTGVKDVCIYHKIVESQRDVI